MNVYSMNMKASAIIKCFKNIFRDFEKSRPQVCIKEILWMSSNKCSTENMWKIVDKSMKYKVPRTNLNLDQLNMPKSSRGTHLLR